MDPQHWRAARSIPEMFTLAIEDWFDLRSGSTLVDPVFLWETADVLGHPGMKWTALISGDPFTSRGYFLPDYSTAAQIPAPDAYRQLGMELSFNLTYRRDAGAGVPGATLATEFIGGPAAFFLVWIEEKTGLTVTAMETDNRTVLALQHFQAWALSKVESTTLVGSFSIAAEIHSWDVDDTPEIRGWGGLRRSFEVSVGSSARNGDIAEAVEQLQYMTADFQLNNGGPSWSLRGNTRVDGEG